jgi:hypothetical protein
LVYLLARDLKKRAELPEAFLAWCASGLLFAAFEGLAIAVFAVDIAPHVRVLPPADAVIWSGFIKDSVIYAVIGLFVGSGLIKFESALPLRHGSSPWVVFGCFAAAAIVVAVGVLLIDVWFAEQVALGANYWEQVWPAPWQRSTVHLHVYVRDFLLLVPGIVVMFGWVGLRIARHSEEVATS